MTAGCEGCDGSCRDCRKERERSYRCYQLLLRVLNEIPVRSPLARDIRKLLGKETMSIIRGTARNGGRRTRNG